MTISETMNIGEKGTKICCDGYHPCSERILAKQGINSSPNDKISYRSKLKALADNKINLNEKLKLFYGWLESIVGIGENAGFQHILLFPQCFQKPAFQGVVKSQDCVVKR